MAIPPATRVITAATYFAFDMNPPRKSIRDEPRYLKIGRRDAEMIGAEGEFRHCLPMTQV
jgi:hypothetical protein